MHLSGFQYALRSGYVPNSVVNCTSCGGRDENLGPEAELEYWKGHVLAVWLEWVLGDSFSCRTGHIGSACFVASLKGLVS